VSALPPLPALPIDEVLPELVAALRSAPAAVLQAPPGAGKTTRVPLALLEAGLLEGGLLEGGFLHGGGHGSGRGRPGQLLMLEPRRVAARAAAHTLAKNLGERPGGTVGYQVRFETVASRDTRILVVTEGILTRRLLRDPTLDGVSLVVLDEFHERSVHTDLALAFVRELLEVRDDLKLLVMSATLDAQGVARFLAIPGVRDGADAPVVTSRGRPFPVRIEHLDRSAPTRGTDAARPLEERMAAAIRNLMVAEDDDGGDVLAFFPGAPEIKRCEERLRARPLPRHRGEDVDLVPLYGALSPAEQDRALERGSRRRVLLATNLAETSLTLEGVTAVIDSGLMKRASHDPATDRDVLETVRISLASAEQRAGRAGRTRPGRCVRLWTQTEHATLETSHAPELARADLAPVLLDVLAFHPGPPAQFPFYEPPPRRALEAASTLLALLGAVDEAGARLTDRGRALAALPVHPRTGAMLLAAAPHHLEQVALAAAILEDDRSWPREPARTTTDSDLELLVETFDARRAREVARARDDLVRLVSRGASAPGDGDLKDALLHGFPDRLCRRRRSGEPEALMAGGRGVILGRESGVKDAELFLALALEGAGAPRGGGGRSGAARVRIAEAVTLEQLTIAMPHLVRTEDEALFDEERGLLLGVRRTRVADLVVAEKDGIAVSAEAAAAALARAIGADLPRHLRLEGEALRARERLLFAARALAEEPWPAVDDEALAALLPEVCAGKRTIAEVRDADWAGVLLTRLTWPQRKLLDEEVPARLEVPSGSMIAVDYGPALLEGGAPVLAVRLQELFGLLETPRVARGRVPVVLHLLSPGHKPVQVTRDLASFWRTTYADVKKELRARYPKHSWPDDPLTAQPTARAVRRRP
jgi:ATP-dependent helicase HrpB